MVRLFSRGKGLCGDGGGWSSPTSTPEWLGGGASAEGLSKAHCRWEVSERRRCVLVRMIMIPVGSHV